MINAITHKVDKIKAAKKIVSDKYHIKKEERTALKNDINNKIKAYELEYIDKKYGSMIKTIEKSRKSNHYIVSENNKVPMHIKGAARHLIEDMRDMNRRDNEDIIIVFIQANDKRNHHLQHGGGWNHHPMEMAMSMMNVFDSIIRVGKDEIVNKEVNKLNKAYDKIDKECIRLNNEMHDFESEISTVRNKKDSIKNNIIEQMLSNSDEGQAMLEKLKSFDFDNTKLLS